MSRVIKKKLKIDGMHCSSCAMTIDFDLEDLEGVSSVQTSYARQECDIEFDEKAVTLEEISKVVEKSGYKVME